MGWTEVVLPVYSREVQVYHLKRAHSMWVCSRQFKFTGIAVFNVPNCVAMRSLASRLTDDLLAAPHVCDTDALVRNTRFVAREYFGISLT